MKTERMALRDAERALTAGAWALEAAADRSENEGYPDCASDDRRLAAQLRALAALAASTEPGSER